MAFTYQVIAAGVGIVACMGSLVLIEQYGRRPLVSQLCRIRSALIKQLIYGGFLQAIFLFVMAGLGRLQNPTQAAGRGIAACVITFTAVFAATWGATPYVLASEIGTGRLREKTMAFSSTVNVIAAFVVSFSLPYLLNAPYAALGAGVGWIYGSFAVIAGVYAYFCVPETKGRALEELDTLFEARVPARSFSGHVVIGPPERESAVEGGHALQGIDTKADLEEQRERV
jgi:SP family sugar:H+ symporter-like MFS transporter